MSSTTGFLLKGLTEQHKQFLSQYAQEKLGSTSRTKAILALIEQQMTIENSKQKKNKKEAKMNELQKQAIEERKTYIEHHQQLIKQRHKDIQKAIKNLAMTKWILALLVLCHTISKFIIKRQPKVKTRQLIVVTILLLPIQPPTKRAKKDETCVTDKKTTHQIPTKLCKK